MNSAFTMIALGSRAPPEDASGVESYRICGKFQPRGPSTAPERPRAAPPQTPFSSILIQN